MPMYLSMVIKEEGVKNLSGSEGRGGNDVILTQV